MTQGEVRVFQESAGHLGSTPLPVGAVKLDIAEILANADGVNLTWERDLEDDLVLIKMTFRHPEFRTLEGESWQKKKNKVSYHDECQLLMNFADPLSLIY